ncbi:MAG: heme exporter protein CcmB [Saprospiraceae bacterium]
MNLAAQVYFLLQKEWRLEWRQKYAISGILLYVFSTVFIVYTAIIQVQPNVWNPLFWIIVLFTSVNAVVKSFVQESGNRELYYYQLVDPVAIILSKILYNSLLLFVLSLLSWAIFSLVTINPVKDTGLFFAALLLGGIGFSITLTFVSAISAKANNSATLLAILGFPLVIPILLTLLKISANALRLIQDTAIGTDLLILVAIDILLLGLAVIMFPFLWRD